MKKRNPITVIIYIALVALLLWTVLEAFSVRGGDLTEAGVKELLRAGEVKSFLVEENIITLNLHHPYDGKTQLEARLADVSAFRQETAENKKKKASNPKIQGFWSC